MTLFLVLNSCEQDLQNIEDCAGIEGGDSICGCTDIEASNYDSTATFDDGSCKDCAGIIDGNNICGCTDETAVNYDSLATSDDGSCQYPIQGCTDPNAANYNPNATIGC